MQQLTLLHSERPKLYGVMASLSAIGLNRPGLSLHNMLIYYYLPTKSILVFCLLGEKVHFQGKKLCHCKFSHSRICFPKSKLFPLIPFWGFVNKRSKQEVTKVIFLCNKRWKKHEDLPTYYITFAELIFVEQNQTVRSHIPQV